jgi:putative transposase
MKYTHISTLSRKEREKTRLKAGKLFQKGLSQAEVARRFKVTPAAVNYWHEAWKTKGVRGLQSKGQTGFPSRLTEEKRTVFRRAILKGPQEYGFETNLWTLSRLASVMKKTTGVTFGHNHTWEIVRALGFTCQKPQVRARERDEEAIKAWKTKRLPGLKKMGSNAWIFSGL